LQHSSLQFSDNKDQWKADCKQVIAHAEATGNVVITGTEAGDDTYANLLRDAFDEAGWWRFVHTSGEWVGFDKKFGSHVDHGWDGPIIAGKPNPGGHQPRGIAWVTVNPDDPSLPQISVGVCHYITQNTMDHHPDQNNEELKDECRRWAKEKGSGDALAFVHGDVNMDDAKKNVFGGEGLTTCWDELQKWPDTHEGGADSTIDVIARLTDDPTKFTSAKALSDADLKLNSDHKLIQAVVKVG